MQGMKKKVSIDGINNLSIIFYLISFGFRWKTSTILIFDAYCINTDNLKRTELVYYTSTHSQVNSLLFVLDVLVTW